MNTIKTFMLGITAGLVDCYIEENNLSDWNIEVVENGLKLFNKQTQQYAEWWLYNYDEDFKVIKDKIIKFLKLQQQLTK